MMQERVLLFGAIHKKISIFSGVSFCISCGKESQLIGVSFQERRENDTFDADSRMKCPQRDKVTLPLPMPNISADHIHSRARVRRIARLRKVLLFLLSMKLDVSIIRWISSRRH